MQASFSKQIQEWIGKKSLDFAERWPWQKPALFAELKITREFQWKELNKTFERSRIPEGVGVKFVGMQLIVPFPFEQVKVVRDELLRLFQSQKQARKTLEEFSQVEEKIGHYGNYKVGILTRVSPKIPVRDTRVLPDLPKEVKFIEVCIEKVLPSLFAISFEVYLSDNATEGLLLTYNKKYLSPIRFNRWIPIGKRITGYSKGSSDAAMKNALRQYRMDIIRKIDAIIRIHIGSLFSSRSCALQEVSPIEIFRITGSNFNKGQAKNWQDQNRYWLNPFSFWGLPWDTYFGDDFIFLFLEKGASFIFISFDKSKDPDQSLYSTQLSLEEIRPALVIHQQIRTVKEFLENQRTMIIGHLSRGFARRSLRIDLELNNRVQSFKFLLERIFTEFSSSKAHLMFSLKGFAKNLHNDKRTIAENLVEWIEWQLNILREHTAVLQNAATTNLSARNIFETHRLQIVAVLLSIFLALFTFFDEVSNLIYKIYVFLLG